MKGCSRGRGDFERMKDEGNSEIVKWRDGGKTVRANCRCGLKRTKIRAHAQAGRFGVAVGNWFCLGCSPMKDSQFPTRKQRGGNSTKDRSSKLSGSRPAGDGVSAAAATTNPPRRKGRVAIAHGGGTVGQNERLREFKEHLVAQYYKGMRNPKLRFKGPAELAADHDVEERAGAPRPALPGEPYAETR